MAVLLQEEAGDNVPVLALLALNTIPEDRYVEVPTEKLAIVDGGPLIDNMQYRRLENMRASIFAVSGTRKVACILFSNRRRVRLFLMDVEEEDEEDEEEEESDTSRDATASTDNGKVTEADESTNVSDEDKENSKESSGMEL